MKKTQETHQQAFQKLKIDPPKLRNIRMTHLSSHQ